MRNAATVLIGIAMSGFIVNGAQAQNQPKGEPWPVPDAQAKVKIPAGIKADAGKDLWAKNCKSCHGVAGKGDGSMSAKLKVSAGDFTSAEFSKATDGELFWKTTEGRKPMPSYKAKLTDSERWALVAYMRTFKK